MTKFLITVWPFAGHYFPVTAIANELRADGHEVAFYTGEKACAVLAGEGFRCFPFEQLKEDEITRMVDSRTTFASLRHPFAARDVMRRWLVDTFPGQVADIARVVDQWQPDVILTETTMWAPTVIFHESHHIPVAVFSNTLGCTLAGAPAQREKLGWRRALRRRLIGLARAAGAAPFRKVVNEARKSRGLPPLTVSINDHGATMPLYLMPSVPEFDYRRQDLPASVHYIGACVWNKARSETTPPWLAELPHDHPWVHVSEGTVNSQQPLVLRAAAQGLANLPLHVVMTTGGNRDPESLDLGAVAPNIRLVRWVAHSDLLPQTDVFVTTGGSGQVITALQFGVPMVVVPTEWDKPENARRVVDAGAGVRLSPQQCTPEKVRAAVQQVLNNPSYRQNAERLGAAMAAYPGPRRAADLLEQLAVHEPVTG